ncbi:hypothetical protein cyc_06226 [Cyclospora cayetanensis]|uniref:Uncharacterized protein n=1 Tax=Cyclospora cayetanensis TaxID=88456 RepID=A0A1D3D4K7_9EIME|nr:hypothetical protein cyc_06226 [Cyclospora cayetanensis]
MALKLASKEASRDSEETARLKAENESLKARLRKLGRLRGAPSSATHEETVPQEPKPETAAPDVGRGTLASVAVSGEEATADETAVSTRPTNSPEEEEDVVVIAPSGARLLHKTLVDGEAERPSDGSSLEMPSPAEIPSSRWRVKPEEKGVKRAPLEEDCNSSSLLQSSQQQQGSEAAAVAATWTSEE